MPTPKPLAEPRLPPRVAWFAPWRWFAHWRPWRRWTLFVGVALVAYFMSFVPACHLVHRTGLAKYGLVTEGMNTFYMPVIELINQVEPVSKFYDAQSWWLSSVFGPPD